MTEVDYTIKVEKIMEVENAINVMIKLAKDKGNYKKGDKLTIMASNPNLYLDISMVVQSDVKAREFMNHVTKIVSSNENINITQIWFNVKIINMPRGQGRRKIIKMSKDVAKDVRTKQCITQINNSDNLCCLRAIVVALTYSSNNIFSRFLSDMDIKQVRMGMHIQMELVQELYRNILIGNITWADKENPCTYT